jgi:hypothetical protein
MRMSFILVCVIIEFRGLLCLLFLGLDAYNKSLLNDVKKYFKHSGPNATEEEKKQYPYPVQSSSTAAKTGGEKDDSVSNDLMSELTLLLESCGMDDPYQKIYITSHPLESLPVLLVLFLITYLPKVCCNILLFKLVLVHFFASMF